MKVLLGKSEAKRKTDLMWDFGRNEAFNKPSDPYDRSPHLAIRSGKWKLLVNGDGSDVRLYDMERDKYEKNDIASEYPDVAGKLSKRYAGGLPNTELRDKSFVSDEKTWL